MNVTIGKQREVVKGSRWKMEWIKRKAWTRRGDFPLFSSVAFQIDSTNYIIIINLPIALSGFDKKEDKAGWREKGKKGKLL